MKKVNSYYPDRVKYKHKNRENINTFFSMNNSEKLKNVLDIVESTINKADEGLLKLLMSAYENDIDNLFDEITIEVYKILYGSDTKGKVQPTIRYLTEVNKAVEEEMACNSLAYFCSNRLGMEMNWHHIEWAWLIENFLLVAILAARDHGKSFFFSHGYPIWMMYKYDKNSMDQMVLNGRNGYLFSNTSSQVIDLMEIIQDSIMDNEVLREKLYPENHRDNWSKGSIKTKNGCRLRARSLGSTVRGAHPGYIILDDPLKDNVLYSKVQRDRNKDYFNASILPMLVPGGQMAVVGTPFHQEDLYSLFRNGIDFAYREYPAIDKDNNLLWEGRHNRDDLDMRRRIQGNILFTREFLVKPVSDQSSLFPERILRRSVIGMEGYSYVPNIEAFPIKFKKVITGCDFAMSSEVGADYTCFVTFGIDSLGNFWLIHIFHEKGVGYYEQRRQLENIWHKFRPDVMFLESNQFQRIYSQILSQETNMPIKPFITTKRKHSMQDGVPGLALLFENGKIKFPNATENDKKVTEKILNEFRSVGWTDKGIQGIGEHDDIVMAIWLARMAELYGSSSFIFDFVGSEEMDESQMMIS